MGLYVDIKVGPYGDLDLNEWVKQTEEQLAILNERVYILEETINKFKEIVPLADEDLGMHDAPTSIS